MKTLIEMRQERADLDDEAQTLLSFVEDAGRGLTAEEQSSLDIMMAGIQRLNDQIKRREEYEAIRAPLLEQPTRTVDEPADPAAAARASMNREEKPFTTLRQTDTGVRIETPRPFGNLMAFGNNPKGYEEAYRSGMWLKANLFGDRKAEDWCRQNGVRATMTEGVNTAGGAVVPDEMERTIINLQNTYGLFRRATRVMPMSTDQLKLPRRTGGPTAYYVGEGVAPTASDASFDTVTLSAKKLAILSAISSELSEDAIINVADFLATECARQFAYQEDLAGFTGDGTSTYGGITGVLVKAVDASHTKAKVAAASGHDQFAELDADDIASLMAAVAEYGRPGAAWYVSPTGNALTFDAIKIAGGGNTMTNLAGSTLPTFLGYPIYVTPVMNDVTTALNGLVMMGFGDLGMASTMGVRRGISVAVDSSVYFTTDRLAIRATQRYDIVAHDLGSTTVKSPFCVLVGTT